MFNLDPQTILPSLAIVLLAIPIHEWAHCWAAYMLGDPTPGSEGRLTLNPLLHLDPIGTLMIFVTGFGWGRAARVNPYQMWRVKNPRVGMAITAFAGPFSNIVLALFFALPFRLGLINPQQAGFLTNFLYYIIVINVGLAMFNLLPIPPLDGSRILAGFAPPAVADFIESLEPAAPVILMVVLFLLPMVGLDLINLLLRPAMTFMLQAIFWW